MSSDAPNTPSSPSCRTRAPTPSCKPADACLCRSLTASKQSLTTTEKSSPLTPKSQPRRGRYAILPSLTTRGNVASTNTRTASSDSTSKKVQTSLCCLMPMSKGSRINSTRAPERYSAISPLARFSPTPRLCVLRFTVEWASSRTCALQHRAKKLHGLGEGNRPPERPIRMHQNGECHEKPVSCCGGCDHGICGFAGFCDIPCRGC